MPEEERVRTNRAGIRYCIILASINLGEVTAIVITVFVMIDMGRDRLV